MLKLNFIQRFSSSSSRSLGPRSIGRKMWKYSSTEQIDHQNRSENHQTPPETTNYEQFHGTPPPKKKHYETMKNPAFFS